MIRYTSKVIQYLIDSIIIGIFTINLIFRGNILINILFFYIPEMATGSSDIRNRLRRSGGCVGASLLDKTIFSRVCFRNMVNAFSRMLRLFFLNFLLVFGRIGEPFLDLLMMCWMIKGGCCLIISWRTLFQYPSWIDRIGVVTAQGQ